MKVNLLLLEWINYEFINLCAKYVEVEDNDMANSPMLLVYVTNMMYATGVCLF